MRLIDADELLTDRRKTKYYHLPNKDIAVPIIDIEHAHTINAIPIPDGATNGDMIKAMFPNAQIDYHEKSDLVDEYVTVFLKDCDTCQDYSYDWWNTPYERGE